MRGLSSSEREIPVEEIQEIARKLKMVYVETSSLNSSGVKDCFDVAVIYA